MEAVTATDEVADEPPSAVASSPSSDRQISREIVIQARPGWKALNLVELWQYRELLYFLALRDVKVRYKQTLLGVVWAVLPPVVQMIIFTVIFGLVARFPTGDIPYPIFVFAGLVPWNFFSKALGGAGSSVVGDQSIISKVYFPRLALPFAKIGGCTFDFVVSFAFMIVLMLYYGFVPGWRMLLILPLLLLTAMAAMGFGTFLAALNVSFRDIRHMIPFALQVALFATPAIYMEINGDGGSTSKPTPVMESTTTGRVDPETRKTDPQPAVSSAGGATNPQTEQGAAKRPKRPQEGVVPDRLQKVFELNPMMGVIASFRAAILNHPLPWGRLAYSTVFIVILFFGGCYYFHKKEDTFADIV